MKILLQQILKDVIYKNIVDANIRDSLINLVQVDYTKDKRFGDFSTNIAMISSKRLSKPAPEVAQMLMHNIVHPAILKMEIAGPGFINFYINSDDKKNIIAKILEEKSEFGRSQLGQGKRIHIEYVSSNPTGPLHVGHGRSAAFGATVANLLQAVGYEVHREYYVNDAGRQMHILATSTWLRYLELFNHSFSFPLNGYKGDYVFDLAKKARDQYQDAFYFPLEPVFVDIHPDEGAENGDKEAHIDDLISRAKTLLGKEKYQQIFNLAKDYILDDIKQDLSEFRVIYDEWFSEQSLVDQGAFEVALQELKKNDCIYEHEGATWFRATAYGDEKDRVLIKENGDRTYFANDIAYHVNKYRRAYDYVIDVLGSDHHGYVPRIRAVLEALGHNNNDFKALLVQFAILWRGEERVQMSTRSGSFVTLRELREEVGNDAVRFFYVMRKNEQHMDFDLELAKSQSNENPVYYIQYAYARICSVFRQCVDKNITHDIALGIKEVDLLITEQEMALLDQLARYPEVIDSAAQSYEPHLLAHYLRLLAHDFHSYYNAHPFLVDNQSLCNARLNLVLATQYVLKNGLTLLGLSSPEKM